MAGQPQADPAPSPNYKIDRAYTLGAPSADTTRVRSCIVLCHELLSDRGEAPGSRLAHDVLAAYRFFDPATRIVFFDALAREFATAPAALHRAAGEYLKDASDANLLELRRASEAPRHELFLRLHEARGGPALLVDMRQQLLQGLGDHPSWAIVEADLAHVLKSVFNRGLLEFHQIDWETPTPILEKLFEHEAVHEIRDWCDLRRRLDADRRCYALFHPAWPEEPLIFTEMALTRGLSSKVAPLLDPDSPTVDADACDCAIFYSISNCQPGLRGFGFGNALLGRAIDLLRIQLPRLTTFATLSPIPGFQPWLSALSHALDRPPKLATLMAKLDRPGWHEDAAIAAELKTELMPLCATYLLRAKHGDEPADPVARFHLANGARLQRVNWLSDVSRAGIERSFGLTANYVYQPANLQRNCETYGTEGRVNTTRRVERLSKRIDVHGLCGSQLRISA